MVFHLIHYGTICHNKQVAMSDKFVIIFVITASFIRIESDKYLSYNAAMIPFCFPFRRRVAGGYPILTKPIMSILKVKFSI